MRERRWFRLAWAGGLAACLLVPAVGSAQASDEAAARLDRVQAAVDSGKVDAARASLESWLASHREEATEDERERARFLRARLASDAAEAESIYRRFAVDAGSRYAPMARLRLGQLRLAGGRQDQALRDLELLRADFPGHPLVAESWYWTGLARRAAGRPDEACEALRRAARAAEDSDRDGLAARARQEARACDEDEVAPSEDETASSGDEAAASWTVQVGAFSTRDAAGSQLDRLDREGHDGRLVPGDDGLVRVRVGRFAREADADRLADRLEAAGFDAVVVSEDGSPSGP